MELWDAFQQRIRSLVYKQAGWKKLATVRVVLVFSEGELKGYTEPRVSSMEPNDDGWVQLIDNCFAESLRNVGDDAIIEAESQDK